MGCRNFCSPDQTRTTVWKPPFTDPWDVDRNHKSKAVLARITWLRASRCVIAMNVTSYVCDGPVTRQSRGQSYEGRSSGGT